ncbi:MAG: hypothetical protein UY95_C0025G0005 [Parcubacteria group bacterium GW2011_GWA2_56_7]|nr:MAG: hypothetical protein UY95_C0025G0005 [Parcubacteria group bacterium GW2011_GWA2_56_7]
MTGKRTLSTPIQMLILFALGALIGTCAPDTASADTTITIEVIGDDARVVFHDGGADDGKEKLEVTPYEVRVNFLGPNGEALTEFDPQGERCRDRVAAGSGGGWPGHQPRRTDARRPDRAPTDPQDDARHLLPPRAAQGSARRDPARRAVHLRGVRASARRVG